MKWFGGSTWRTSTSKQTKRVFEEELELPSRKKRVSLAINDVEAALSRLREVTGTETPKIYPSDIKHNSLSPEIKEGSVTATVVAAADTGLDGETGLYESQTHYTEIEEDKDAVDNSDYLTAQESSSVSFEEEENLEELLSSLEPTHPDRQTSSIKSESVGSANQSNDSDIPESQQLYDSWSSNGNLTDETSDEEMGEREYWADHQRWMADQRRKYDSAWETPDTSDKDQSEDENSEDEEMKCYRSLVKARTSFEQYENPKNEEGYDGFGVPMFWEERSIRDDRRDQDGNGTNERLAGYTDPFDSDYDSGLSPSSRSSERKKQRYYGSPEIGDDILPYRHAAHETKLGISPVRPSSPFAVLSPPPASSGPHISQQQSVSDAIDATQSLYDKNQFSFQHSPSSVAQSDTHNFNESQIDILTPPDQHWQNSHEDSNSISDRITPDPDDRSQYPDKHAPAQYSPTDKQNLPESPAISGKYYSSPPNYGSQNSFERTTYTLNDTTQKGTESLYGGNQRSDGHSSTSRSSQYPVSFGDSWLRRRNTESPQSPKSYGSPSLDSFSDDNFEGKYRSPSALPCISTEEESPVSHYSRKRLEESAQSAQLSPDVFRPATPSDGAFAKTSYSFLFHGSAMLDHLSPVKDSTPKKNKVSPRPSPDGSPPKLTSPVIDLTADDNPSPKIPTPRRTGFTPINDVPPLRFPTFSRVKKEHEQPLFAAERFSTFITPRSPARQARLESASKLKTFFHHNSNASFSVSSEDIYLPNLKSTSPELDVVNDPLRISLGRTALLGDKGDDSVGGIEVWEAKCLEMGEKRIRFMRIGESVRDSGEVCL